MARYFKEISKRLNLPQHPLHVQGSRVATRPRYGRRWVKLAKALQRKNTLEGFMGAIEAVQKSKFFSRPGTTSTPGKNTGMRIWERSRRIANTPGTYPVRTFAKTHKQIQLYKLGVQKVRPAEGFYRNRPWGSQFMPSTQADLSEVPSLDARPLARSHKQKFVQRDRHGFLRNRLKR